MTMSPNGGRWGKSNHESGKKQRKFPTSPGEGGRGGCCCLPGISDVVVIGCGGEFTVGWDSTKKGRRCGIVNNQKGNYTFPVTKKREGKKP